MSKIFHIYYDAMFEQSLQAPGFVLGSVDFASGETKSTAQGFLRGDSAQKVTESTIYDCASLTKSVVTATIIQKLVEKKELSLSDNVAAFFDDSVWPSEISIADALAFRVNFDIQLSAQKELPADQIKQKVLSSVMTRTSKQNPINATSMVLGWIAENVTDQTLETLAQEYIFQPLAMKDSSLMFSVDDDRTAPSEVDDWRSGVVCGQVHDESAWVFAREGVAVGSAGMFSTVPDLLKFMKWKWEHQFDFLGWEKNASWMPDLGQDIYGKSGFTGCGLVFAPAKNQAALLLTNATYPHRPSDRQKVTDFRKKMLNQAFEL